MELNKLTKLPTSFTIDKAASTSLPYGTVEAVIATEDLDRHNEHMSVKGIEISRTNYKAYYNHSYNGPTDLPVGLIENLRKSQGKLIGRIKLAVAEYPFADQLYKMIIGGYIDSMSIGFIPKEWDEDTQTWTKSEFMEASFVAEPANVQALVAAKSLDKGEADKLFEMEKSFVQEVKAKSADRLAELSNEITLLPLNDVKSVLQLIQSSIGELETLVNQPANSTAQTKSHLIKLRLAGKKVDKATDELNRTIKYKLSLKG